MGILTSFLFWAYYECNMKLLVRLLINAVAVLICAYFIPGVAVDGFVSALWVAVALAILNTFLKPILMLISFPINLITFGLFTIVVNTIIILLADYLVPGLTIETFWLAVLFGIVLTIVSGILDNLD